MARPIVRAVQLEQSRDGSCAQSRLHSGEARWTASIPQSIRRALGQSYSCEHSWGANACIARRTPTKLHALVWNRRGTESPSGKVHRTRRSCTERKELEVWWLDGVCWKRTSERNQCGEGVAGSPDIFACGHVMGPGMLILLQTLLTVLWRESGWRKVNVETLSPLRVDSEIDDP